MEARQDNSKLYLTGLVAFAVALFVLLSLIAPGFSSLGNLNSMGFQMPEFSLLALALLPAMLSGGIDLSVVSTANLAAIIAAVMMRTTPELAFFAIPAALIVGVGCGLINGVLIAYLRLPPILATLGTMELFSGISIVITGGPAITGLPQWYTQFGHWSLGGVVPLPLIIFLVAAGLIGFVLKQTAFGMRVRLFGTNPVAARFAGIREQGLLLRIYALSGFVAAMAGLIVLARVNSANADYGSSYLLLVILINILAGVAATGGFGTVSGLVAAVVCLQFISSGLNFLEFPAFTRDLCFGGLLIIAMAVRVLSQHFEIFRFFPKKSHSGKANER